MNKIGLKEIEIWQQNYKFDYSCFDSFSTNLEAIRIHLEGKNNTLTLLDISKIFKNGNLYKKSLEEKSIIIQTCLGVSIDDLPENTLIQDYRNSYIDGVLAKHVTRVAFRAEMTEYLINLNIFLNSTNESLNLPPIEKLDLEIFIIAYAMFCGSYVKEEKDFLSYLQMIYTEKLNPINVGTIGRNHLNNPLFYQFIRATMSVCARPEIRVGIDLKRMDTNMKWLRIIYENFLVQAENIKISKAS